MDEVTLTLSSPITEEQWDMIADVDFDYTLESEYCENCQEWDCDYCRAEKDSTERRTDE